MPTLSAGPARCAEEVAQAQALRYRVFAGECGARLASRGYGRDEDAFDAWCVHLVVRDECRGTVVGTYRVLTSERAARAGSFYSETELDLTGLQRYRTGLCEIGRACVDPGYRGGVALHLLWQAVAVLMREGGSTHLIGCASVPLAGDGESAASLWRRLAPDHLAPADCRVVPRRPLLSGGLARVGAAAPNDPTAGAAPMLMRGYLRMGAWIGGEPARDDDFGSADFFMILPIERMSARYARHYLMAA